MWLVFTFCQLQQGYAQKRGVYAKVDSTLQYTNETYLSTSISLHNTNDQPIEITYGVYTPKGIKVVGDSLKTIELEPHEKIFMPVRFMVSSTIPSGEKRIEYILKNTEGQILHKSISQLHIRNIRNVSLSHHTSNAFMKQVADSLSLSVLVANEGNTDELITLTASFPTLKGSRVIETYTIHIPPSQDSLLTFKKIITEEMLSMNLYYVNIAALYDDGDLIGNIPIQIQSLSSSRMFGSTIYGYNFDSYSQNQIGISIQNAGNFSESYKLRGQGFVQLSENNDLHINIDGLHYKNIATRPLFTNTYVQWKAQNIGFQVGNIAEDSEKFIYGRGAKISIGDESDDLIFEAGWLEKSYNLLGDEFAPTNNRGQTAFARVALKKERDKQFNIQAIYDKGGAERTESILIMNKYAQVFSPSLRMDFELGSGYTFLTDQGQNPSSKHSIAIGHKMEGNWNGFVFNTNNFYSSGYYPGTRRGALQLQERISHTIGKLHFSTAYSYFRTNPTYLYSSSLHYPRIFTSNSLLESGVYFPLSTAFTFSITLKNQKEKGDVRLPNDTYNTQQSLSSLRMAETLSWKSKDSQHRLYFTSENGWSRSPFTHKRSFQLRTHTSWVYKFLTLSTHFQKGNFYLIEAYRASLSDQENPYRLDLSAYAQHSFFHKKLNTSVNISMGKDTYSEQNWMFAASADYILSKYFSTFAQSYVYAYNSSYFRQSYTTVNLGVNYKLPKSLADLKKKTGHLKLFFFYDYNANGLFDDDDKPATGRIAMINGLSFMSDVEGYISYKKVPYGNYDLSVPGQKWHAQIGSKVFVDQKNQTVYVPLQKSGRVTGNIIYIYEKNISMEFKHKLGGLKVWMINENGQRKEVYTNTDGTFTALLPIGTYTVEVDEKSLPENVMAPAHSKGVHIIPEQKTTIEPIQLKVRQKTVEIKRFGF